jgi:asparagine N-glycosylation enzyme membrane subunit Stt3
MLLTEVSALLPVATGTLAVVAVYLGARSVVAATLAGAVVYGVAFWLIG